MEETQKIEIPPIVNAVETFAIKQFLEQRNLVNAAKRLEAEAQNETLQKQIAELQAELEQLKAQPQNKDKAETAKKDRNNG